MESRLTPQPGDAVIASGKYGVIDSDPLFKDEGKVLVVFGASAFRPRSKPEYVSCSGGPCPFIPTDRLTLVGHRTQRFWEWKDIPRAGGGVEYLEPVRLWSYDGDV